MILNTASVFGVVKMLFILTGVMVFLRFIGRLMIAKRNLEEEREWKRKSRDFERERQQKMRLFGKTEVITKKERQANKNSMPSTVQDVEFEEV
jgi:hypothetical protein